MEPQAGWKVDAFHYHTRHKCEGAVDDWGQPASVFLAQDTTGQARGVQWWSYSEPTAFHGEWSRGAGTLFLRFNARGPISDEGNERALKGTYLHLEPEGTYRGYDQSRRQVMVVSYGSWRVQAHGGALVWVEDSDTSVL